MIWSFVTTLSVWMVGQTAEATKPLAASPSTTVSPSESKPGMPSPSPSVSAAINPVEAPLFSYNPFGKRDPFRSFLDEKGLALDKAGDPLLNFDLTKFTLTGIVWGIPNPLALVVDGDSRGHNISRGTRIGRNRGQVTRILKDQVIIAEEYRDPLGKLMVSEFVMKLNMKEDHK